MALKVDKRPLGEGAESYIVKIYGPTISQDSVEDGGVPAVTVIVRCPVEAALAAGDKTSLADYVNMTNLDGASFAGE